MRIAAASSLPARRGRRPAHDRGDYQDITDLERIGDECEKIGLIAARLATIERPADRYREVKHLDARYRRWCMTRSTPLPAWMPTPR